MKPETQNMTDRILVEQLDTRLAALEAVLAVDVITFIGPIVYGVDDAVRDAVESRPARRPHLAVLLETPGGYVEVAERIATTLRGHYSRVDFIIPNHAFSAGTVLVMSGDAIWMDYYAVLGPIDPQIELSPDRGFVPALGYLVQYQRLLDKAATGLLSAAELAWLIEKFDPAELYAFEQQRELSITLLKNWLATYKFKNWHVTATRRLPVTPAMRTERAREIAEALNRTEQWHSHSRGLSMAVLRDELNLLIDDFGAIPAVRECVHAYHQLLLDYLQRAGASGAIHMPGRYLSLPMEDP